MSSLWENNLLKHPQNTNCISNEIREWVDRLLLEKIPLGRDCACRTRSSERWLQYYVNDKYDATPRKLTVHCAKKKRN